MDLFRPLRCYGTMEVAIIRSGRPSELKSPWVDTAGVPDRPCSVRAPVVPTTLEGMARGEDLRADRAPLLSLRGAAGESTGKGLSA